MNEYAIHVGTISESYRNLWGNINPVMVSQDATKCRSILQKATQEVSHSRHLFEPLAIYVEKHPDIEYIPNSSKPIKIDSEGNDIYQSADTWLLKSDRFEYNGDVYRWAPDILLTQQDEYFDAFFALKWGKVDVIQGDEFLIYQQQQGNWADKGKFVRYLRKLVIKYPDILTSPMFDKLIDEYENLDEIGQAVIDTKAGLKSIEIKLPKVPPRRNGDDKTVLGQKETAKLFSYLRQVGIILKDTSYLSEANVHKAIQVLTGYNDSNFRKSEVSASISKTELKNLKNILNRVIILIDIELEAKKGHNK